MPTFRVVISGWREGLRKVSLTQELQTGGSLSLAAAKAVTDRVLDGVSVSLGQPSREAAEQLARRLDALGAVASVTEETSEEEFLEDFGASLTQEELDQLLERARRTDDRDVRMLVKQFTTLRRVAADFLVSVDDRDAAVGADAATPGKSLSYPLGMLRFLLRDMPPKEDT